jgi:CRISPR-associated protein Cas1
MKQEQLSGKANLRGAASGALPGGTAADGGNDRLFRLATAPETLWKAWDKVRANNGAAGADGVTVERFGFFAAQAIPMLSERLRRLSYRPAGARRVMVPKKSGGLRPLDIPAVVDRVAQGAAVLALTPELEPLFEPSSFAYRPGRGVADAVSKVASYRRQGFTHVIDADIRRYFENVPHEPLLAKLEQVVGDDAILDLVALWLEWYGPSGEGLAQGSPLSPLLANLYLDLLDETFEGRGIRLVRYADDFVLLCRSEAIARRTLPDLERFLGEHGLELNAEKTRIVPFEQGFRFLGHLFVRSMVLKEVIDEAPAEDAIAAAEAAHAVLAAADAPQAPPLTGALGEPQGERVPGQRVLHVVEPGRRLGVRGESFHVTAGAATLLLLPHRKLDRIEVGPGNDIDVDSLDLAAAAGVTVVRVNGHGETLGTWSAPEVEKAHARRHLAQAALIFDPARRLALARILVAGRLRSQRAVLHRINRDRKLPDIVAAAAALNRPIRRVAVAQSVPAAMGYEGEGAAHYWPALGQALAEPLGFAGKRRRRPAGSAFDLVLNGLTSLLQRDVRIALVRAGLHPGFAVLHESADGEDALSYDLMEEFRAPLVEATAVALVNRRAIVPTMFSAMTGYPALSRDGWAALVRGYEVAASRAVARAGGGTRSTWRQWMSIQAGAMARHVDSGEPYLPIDMDY